MVEKICLLIVTHEIYLNNKCGEILLNSSLYLLFCRGNLEEILQTILDELRFKNSFKTLVEILQLEAQKQNEEAQLLSMVERNVKEIKRLHLLSKKEFKEGMDKINDKHDIIASLKVRIITVVSVIHSKFLRCKYSEVDTQASTGKNTCLRLHSNSVKVKVFIFKIFLAATAAATTTTLNMHFCSEKAA